nr:MAG TPA: hypothetical protein [Caudoviricetes sp.]
MTEQTRNKQIAHKIMCKMFVGFKNSSYLCNIKQ